MTKRKGTLPAALILMMTIVACKGNAAEVSKSRPPSPSASIDATFPSPYNDRPSTSDLKANSDKSALASLPQDVLVGTDVEKLAGYLSRRAPIRIPGLFEGNQGGAKASIKVISVGPKIEMTRTFKEPGAKAQAVQYRTLVSSDNGQRLSGQNLELFGVKEGAIVLEKKSGVDGIPPTLWIFYRYKAKKH
ncbi:MAG TPA: hypothetical protein VH374_07835 [Polyangia bacterium]|jgi:hypothetical protein|nr:hypothetical protein [Polyangia bacterium]